MEAAASDMPFCAGPGFINQFLFNYYNSNFKYLIHFSVHKVTTLLVDGRRVRLQLWDTSGQGRFCTILRSYSRGAQGILLVYDLTNKWSFDGIDRWRREVEEVSNVLHNKLSFEKKREIGLLYIKFSCETQK